VEVQLTEREASLMEVLWQRGPSTVTEVKENLSDALAYTTVLTVLRTLEAKGYVGHNEEGRAHRYMATVARDAARRSAMRALTRKLFGGSVELLLTQLVSDEDLTNTEVQRIKRLLDQRRKGEKS
jgi:predicted transcriptional regulator